MLNMKLYQSSMNKIKIKYIASHYKLNYCDKKEYFQVPLFKVIIDKKDLFKFDEIKNRYESVKLSDFILNDRYDINDYCLNGIFLIGICSSCRLEGCDDLFVNIKTENGITQWDIYPERLENIKITKYFDAKLYMKEIIKLWKCYLNYSWKSFDHILSRACNKNTTVYTRSTNNVFELKNEDPHIITTNMENKINRIKSEEEVTENLWRMHDDIKEIASEIIDFVNIISKKKKFSAIENNDQSELINTGNIIKNKIKIASDRVATRRVFLLSYLRAIITQKTILVPDFLKLVRDYVEDVDEHIKNYLNNGDKSIEMECIEFDTSIVSLNEVLCQLYVMNRLLLMLPEYEKEKLPSIEIVEGLKNLKVILNKDSFNEKMRVKGWKKVFKRINYIKILNRE